MNSYDVFRWFVDVHFGRRMLLPFFISNGGRYHGHQKEFAFNVHWSLKAKHDLSSFKADNVLSTSIDKIQKSTQNKIIQ